MSKEPESTSTGSKPASATPRVSSAPRGNSESPTAPGDQVTREQIADDLRRTISDARAYLEQLGMEGRERARTQASQTQDQLQQWCDEGEDMIRRKPLMSVGMALGIGYIIGKLGS